MEKLRCFSSKGWHVNGISSEAEDSNGNWTEYGNVALLGVPSDL